MPGLPATGARALAARAGRSWRRSRWSLPRGGEGPAPISGSVAPGRSIWVAAVCRSRCAPTRGSPARSHASADHPRDRAPIQPLPRCGHAQEQRSAIGSRTTAQIGHDRLADIDRQRQGILTAALARAPAAPRPPVEVVEGDRGDLAGPQPEPRQQQQDREIAATDQRAPVTAGQQPA